MYMLVCYFMHPCPLKISGRLPRHLREACCSSQGDWEAQYIVPLHTLHEGNWWQRKPPALVKFLQQRITSTSWPLFPVWSGRSETKNVETSMAVKYISGFRWFRVVTHPAHRRNRGSVAPFPFRFPAPITSSIPYWKQRERNESRYAAKYSGRETVSHKSPANTIFFSSGELCKTTVQVGLLVPGAPHMQW